MFHFDSITTVNFLIKSISFLVRTAEWAQHRSADKSCWQRIVTRPIVQQSVKRSTVWRFLYQKCSMQSTELHYNWLSDSIASLFGFTIILCTPVNLVCVVPSACILCIVIKALYKSSIHILQNTSLSGVRKNNQTTKTNILLTRKFVLEVEESVFGRPVHSGLSRFHHNSKPSIVPEKVLLVRTLRAKSLDHRPAK